MAQSCPRFNGAATLSLRKCLQLEKDLERGTHPLQWGRNFIVAEMCSRRPGYNWSGGRSYQASMEPQLYRCGNGKAALVTIGGGLLQWGRNFIVAEMQDQLAGSRATSQASMGPQLYRCGNAFEQ